MATISTLGIVGVDGRSPIYDETGLWRMWSKDDVWDGTVGANRIVPKVNDYVIDPPTYEMWIVRSLDPITLIPTLGAIRPANMVVSLQETDILFGVGPGTQSDTYRVYLDKSVTPYVMSVDTRLRVAGSMSSYAKIFKGSDLSSTPQVVSKIYDTNGIVLTDRVPLELAAIDNYTNTTIKTVRVCYCVDNLLDGEVVTAVFYSDDGHVVSKRQLLVENTAFIRSMNVSQKYVTSIALESPFLAPTSDVDIEFPLDIPLSSLSLVGVVNYSDGSSLRLNVGAGSKFKIFGLEQYVSSIVGQRTELVLSYALSSDEVSYSINALNNNITRPYSLTSVAPNNTYRVKLYGYPVWKGAGIGYEIRWFLYDMDHNTDTDVTAFVIFDANTGPFNPLHFGYLQRKSVSVNLNDVSPVYRNFIHTQLVDIFLVTPPNGTLTPWTISNDATTNATPFGSNKVAVIPSSSDTIYHIDCGYQTLTAWLDGMYKASMPLYDTRLMSTPIAPSHYVVEVNGISTTHPVADWNTQHVANNVTTMAGKTITLKFIKQMPTSTLSLGVVCLLANR